MARLRARKEANGKHANQTSGDQGQLMATATTGSTGKLACPSPRGWMAYYAVPMSGSSNLCIPASYDRTLARRLCAAPAAPINVDPDETIR